MKIDLKLKSIRTQARLDSDAPAVTAQRKSDPNWKPEPCGLTREELRKLVAEILG